MTGETKQSRHTNWNMWQTNPLKDSYIIHQNQYWILCLSKHRFISSLQYIPIYISEIKCVYWSVVSRVIKHLWVVTMETELGDSSPRLPWRKTPLSSVDLQREDDRSPAETGGESEVISFLRRMDQYGTNTSNHAHNIPVPWDKHCGASVCAVLCCTV